MTSCTCLAPKNLPRRGFLGAAALAGLSLSTPRWALADNTLPDNRIGGDAALKRLMEGNARFVAGQMQNRDMGQARHRLTAGQRPIAAVLGCADSRVSPELAFDQGLGDLFVVRLAGNFANNDGIASLEYATQVLNVPLIMVLGHSHCGAVAATLKVQNENAVLPGHLPALAESIRPAVQSAVRRQPSNLLAAATADNVLHAVARLSTSAPVLGPQQQRAEIKVVGAIYDLESGQVTVL